MMHWFCRTTRTADDQTVQPFQGRVSLATSTSIFDRTDVLHLWTGSPVSTDGKIMSFFYAKKKNLVRNDPFYKVSVYFPLENFDTGKKGSQLWEREQ